MRTSLLSTLLYDTWAFPTTTERAVGSVGNDYTATTQGIEQGMFVPAPPAYSSPYTQSMWLGAYTRAGTEMGGALMPAGTYEVMATDVTGWASFNYGNFGSWVPVENMLYMIGPTGRFVGPGTATVTYKVRRISDGAIVGSMTHTLSSAT